LKIFLVAAEPSGDALGADLMKALRARAPDVEFHAIGGAAMAAAGAPSLFDISDLSVLGLIDGLKAWDRVVKRADQAAAAIAAAKPDAVVLIDSWGFTLRVAQRVRPRLPGVPLIKYVGPQVWASRAGRAKTLAAAVDHLICIHDFEVPFYAPFGLSCTVCGHPAMGRYTPGDGAAFRAKRGLAPDARLLLVLPGSRTSELRRIGPTLAASARALAAARPDMKLALVAAGPVREAAIALLPEAMIVEEAEKDHAFAAATVALAASGTVTTEVALQGAPLVVAYKLGWITWAIARMGVMTAKFATLMNVALNREAVPEFLQTRMTVANITAAAAALLDDPAKRAAQIVAQNEALQRMGRGGPPAGDIAAEAVLAQIAKRKPAQA
jgi:lipid-A-disaccharide synthase